MTGSAPPMFLLAMIALFMKRRYIYSLLLFLLCVGCRAQKTGVVFDMETRRPVDNVKVYVNPAGRTVTDRHGRFIISGSCHSVTFSHVSYESRSMHKTELRDTVWLMPKMNTLDEVVITAVGPKMRLNIEKISKDASTYGKHSSGMSFDLFSIFDKSQKRKSGKERERFNKILKNY